MIIFFVILLGLLAFGLPILMLLAMCAPQQGYRPMPFDEEVEWLMAQGLSKEEAEEIANIL